MERTIDFTQFVWAAPILLIESDVPQKIDTDVMTLKRQFEPS